MATVAGTANGIKPKPASTAPSISLLRTDSFKSRADWTSPITGKNPPIVFIACPKLFIPCWVAVLTSLHFLAVSTPCVLAISPHLLLGYILISGKEYDGISPPLCSLSIFLLIFIISFCIRCNISIICTIS